MGWIVMGLFLDVHCVFSFDESTYHMLFRFLQEIIDEKLV
jgi:hypothetical protein